jgi:hypothetical protein
MRLFSYKRWRFHKSLSIIFLHYRPNQLEIRLLKRTCLQDKYKHLLQDSKTDFILLWTHQLEIPKETVGILVKYIHAPREYYKV